MTRSGGRWRGRRDENPPLLSAGELSDVRPARSPGRRGRGRRQSPAGSGRRPAPAATRYPGTAVGRSRDDLGDRLAQTEEWRSVIPFAARSRSGAGFAGWRARDRGLGLTARMVRSARRGPAGEARLMDRSHLGPRMRRLHPRTVVKVLASMTIGCRRSRSLAERGAGPVRLRTMGGGLSGDEGGESARMSAEIIVPGRGVGEPFDRVEDGGCALQSRWRWRPGDRAWRAVRYRSSARPDPTCPGDPGDPPALTASGRRGHGGRRSGEGGQMSVCARLVTGAVPRAAPHLGNGSRRGGLTRAASGPVPVSSGRRPALRVDPGQLHPRPRFGAAAWSSGSSQKCGSCARPVGASCPSAVCPVSSCREGDPGRRRKVEHAAGAPPRSPGRDRRLETERVTTQGSAPAIRMTWAAGGSRSCGSGARRVVVDGDPVAADGLGEMGEGRRPPRRRAGHRSRRVPLPHPVRRGESAEERESRPGRAPEPGAETAGWGIPAGGMMILHFGRIVNSST